MGSRWVSSVEEKKERHDHANWFWHRGGSGGGKALRHEQQLSQQQLCWRRRRFASWNSEMPPRASKPTRSERINEDAAAEAFSMITAGEGRIRTAVGASILLCGAASVSIYGTDAVALVPQVAAAIGFGVMSTGLRSQ